MASFFGEVVTGSYRLEHTCWKSYSQLNIYYSTSSFPLKVHWWWGRGLGGVFQGQWICVNWAGGEEWLWTCDINIGIGYWVKKCWKKCTCQVSKEEGVLIFAEGEVASTFARMLFGDGKAELVGEVVTKEEERVVAEVVRGAVPGATVVLVKRNVGQADSLALARWALNRVQIVDLEKKKTFPLRLTLAMSGDDCTTLAITARFWLFESFQ